MGAAPEIVRDGANGLICRNGDANALAEKLLYLAERPELREQMSRNNLQRFAQFFTVERFATRMVAAFENLFAGWAA